MSAYLSAEWFAELREITGPAAEAGPGGEAGPADVVLRQVVTGTPEGDVIYQVEIRAGHASLVPGASGEADMTFTSDYPTAAAIARGELSTQVALLEGRIRVTGNPAVLATRADSFGHLDPVPAVVRARTTYR